MNRTGLLILALLPGTIPSVSAAPGEPGSPAFGIGARLDLYGPGFQNALGVLSSLHLDWVSIEYSWENFSPTLDSVPDYSLLDKAIDAAQANDTSVLLSLTHPPAWATTPTGPNPSAVTRLLTALLKRYPGHLQAIELFPAPNTRNGWGALPDAAAYLKLYRAASAVLKANSSESFLVAGGVEVISSPTIQGDLSDANFLDTLFYLAKDSPPAVVGLRYPSVLGSPSAPDDGRYPAVLRHYEEIRRQIRAGGHPATLLWITYLGLPAFPDRAAQTSWLAEAYPQVRSQLYIGAAFLQGLNTCPSNNSCAEVNLLEQDGSLHPFASLLTDLIQDGSTTGEIQPGHTKSNILFKSR